MTVHVSGRSISALLFVFLVATGVWAIRHQAREVLPLKRRLEALLKELDAP